ncbi:LLM class flavin-dependent oxidoreductase [Cellvibrio sp. PSBB006]|uniref:LLM class flavin-dependent oxidoreductase n=1 Tax=Cellvibrio sp. PSBB006 TaxID=1987723 RepID=UPI000B3B8FA9|nr:LLM class flavin-dependent oxidoreductase [Cellvibrio sp. PSBB006]ARU27150.1 LLM class flavin-dependent oxidoreductase [Cellvibrio sp. PSBB006]
MLHNIPFSLLELASVREGNSIHQTLQNSLAYAQTAEQLGFKRFWLAEHHNMEGIASSATAVLIGYIAGGTQTLRIGSGGIMLPNHPPLVIAEQFGTLASLYPDRIDLGLGRAPGTDPITARALRRDDMRADNFPTEVHLLQQLLAPLQDGQRLKAIPGAGTQVPIWLLGSSLYSAQLAAQRGLPYAFAGHFAPRLMRDAIRIYQTQFQPSAVLEKPYAMLGMPVIVADTEDEAIFLSTTSQQRILALLRGQPLWLKPPVDSMDGLWNIEEELYVKDFLSLAAIGNPAQVKAKLERWADELEINEFMFTIDLYDPQQRIRALKLLTEMKK